MSSFHHHQQQQSQGIQRERQKNKINDRNHTRSSVIELIRQIIKISILIMLKEHGQRIKGNH